MCQKSPAQSECIEMPGRAVSICSPCSSLQSSLVLEAYCTHRSALVDLKMMTSSLKLHYQLRIERSQAFNGSLNDFSCRTL